MAHQKRHCSLLVTQLSWTKHLKIMSACKTMDERIFYMNMYIKERLSKRELDEKETMVKLVMIFLD